MMERSLHSIFKFTYVTSKKLFDKRLAPTVSEVYKRYSSAETEADPISTKKANLTAGFNGTSKKQMHVLIDRILEEKGKTNEIDWAAIQKDVLQHMGVLNEKNIPSKIFNILSEFKDLDTGKSFLNYLKSHNIPFSLGMYLMYFKMCDSCKDQLTEEDRLEVLSMYEVVLSRYNALLVGLGAEEVVPGVALTDRWEEGLNLLETSKHSNMPGSRAYSSLIESATSHGKLDIALSLFEDCLHNDRWPRNTAVSSFAEQCAKLGDFVLFERLLHLMNENTFTPDRNFAEASVRLCSNEQIPFTCVETTISQTGDCRQCQRSLPEVGITEDEHVNLRTAFMSDTIIGSNIFTNTNPAELKNFLHFIKKSAPYDVVIDGLNVAFMTNKSTRNANKSFYLATVANHFVQKQQKVLVLGRKHMINWRDKDMDFVRSNCLMFLTDNLSTDDPFMLYATMYSNLGTRFVSRDFMRPYKHILKTKGLKRTFKLWQQAHQILPIRNYTKINLQYPPKYLLFPHKLADGTWHIPYREGNISYLMDYNNFCPDTLNDKKINWLCLSPSNKKLKS